MNQSTQTTAYIALFVALTAICSWIMIPSPVPFTLQTFAVFLTCFLLGGKIGSITIIAYIVLGAAGLPVFSGFRGGFGALLGPTGGYIIGFVFSALVIWLITSVFGKNIYVYIISAIPALLVCYAFGTAWYVLIYTKSTETISIISVLSMCVIPYIIPDIIKICLAVFLSSSLKKRLPKEYFV